MEEMPSWEQRFRAPSIGFPAWARDAPDRMAVASNESGAWQVHTWDRARGVRPQVTDDAIGVPGGAMTPDVEGVVWFHDATGDEVGVWLTQPFEGDRGRGRRGRPAAAGRGCTRGVERGAGDRRRVSQAVEYSVRPWKHGYYVGPGY